MTLNPIAAIANTAGKAFGAYQGRKQAAEAGAFRVEEAKINARVKREEADANRYSLQSTQDATYDQHVLRNRTRSWTDDYLIFIFTFPIFLLFVVAPIGLVFAQTDFGLLVHVGASLQALNNAPDWYMFVIIGIAVSTLGLMGLFRLWFGKQAAKKQEVDAKPKPA